MFSRYENSCCCKFDWFPVSSSSSFLLNEFITALPALVLKRSSTNPPASCLAATYNIIFKMLLSARLDSEVCRDVTSGEKNRVDCLHFGFFLHHLQVVSSRDKFRTHTWKKKQKKTKLNKNQNKREQSKRFDPLTPKISSVIILTVCHTISMMLVLRIWN